MAAVWIKLASGGIPISAIGVVVLAGCRSAAVSRAPVRLAASWATPDSPPTVEPDSAGPRPASMGNWHIDVAMRGSYPKLASSKRQLDRRLDLPLRLDWAGVFDEPYTPLDRKTDLGLTTWYLGAGRQESEHFVWTVYAGGGAGQDLNHQRFLFTQLKVDFHYAYYFTGFTAEYFPWPIPDAVPDAPWTVRLGASRPYLLTGVETGYVNAEGEGDYKVSGALVYHDEQKVRDWLASVAVGAGWSIPFTDHWSLNLSGDYRFHAYRPNEYNGWNWTTAVRYRF